MTDIHIPALITTPLTVLALGAGVAFCVIRVADKERRWESAK